MVFHYGGDIRVPQMHRILNSPGIHFLAFTLLFSSSIYLFSSTLFPQLIEAQYDDSFITYRYAFNLYHGGSFTFNQDEFVNSASSLLFVLILTPFAYFGIEMIPEIGVIFGIVSLGMTGALCVSWSLKLRYTLTGLGIGLIAAVAVLNATNVYWASSGMETPIFIFVLLFALLLSTSPRLLQRNLHIFILVVSLIALSLLRPEGIAVATAIGVGVSIRIKCSLKTSWLRRMLLVAGTPVLMGVGYLSWNRWYFDSWIPNPVRFKRLAEYYTLTTPENIREFLVYVFVRLGPLALILSIVGIYLGLKLGSGSFRDHALRMLPAWVSLVVFLVFLGLASYSDQYRYLTPLSAFASWGILQMSYIDIQKLKPRRQAERMKIQLVFLLVVLCLWQIPIANRMQSSVGPQTQLQLARAEMGRWLEINTPSESRVLSGDLGAISYFNPSNHYIDSVGLTNKKLLDDLLRGIPYSVAIKSYLPDYLADTQDQNLVTGSENTYNAPQNYFDGGSLKPISLTTLREDFTLHPLQIISGGNRVELSVGAYDLSPK